MDIFAFISSWVFSFAVWRILVSMMFTTRVYRSADVTIEKVLSVMRNGLGNKVWRIGAADIWREYTLHAIIISFNPFTVIISYVERLAFSHVSELSITVYRINGSLPIIPDPIPSIPTEPGKTVDVFDIGNCYEGSYNSHIIERVTDVDNMPQNAYNFSIKLSDAMISTFNERNDTFGRVFMVHGPPGCGKTVATRLFASHTEATLAADYQPTERQSTMRMFTDMVNKIVMVSDEFDNALLKIVEKSVNPDNGKKKTHPDAYDKPSWNNLLDKIHRRKDIILILITNKSVEDIQYIVGNDISLIRFGRIDMHFVYSDNGDVLLIKPIEFIDPEPIKFIEPEPIKCIVSVPPRKYIFSQFIDKFKNKQKNN